MSKPDFVKWANELRIRGITVFHSGNWPAVERLIEEALRESFVMGVNYEVQRTTREKEET